MIAQIQQKHADEAAIEQHLDVEEQRYQTGLQDGMKSMLRGSLCTSVSYMAGYREGLNRRVRFNVTTEEQWLERGWGDELLNDEF
jgi:hypothetical protein